MERSSWILSDMCCAKGYETSLLRSEVGSYGIQFEKARTFESFWWRMTAMLKLATTNMWITSVQFWCRAL